MENKIHILKDEPLISGYLRALKTKDEELKCALLNTILKRNPSKIEVASGIKYEDVGPHVTYQFIELGGMDFTFEYKSHRLKNGLLDTNRLGFTYRNGDIQFKNRRKHLSFGFRNNMERYKLDEILEIRVPNLSSHYPEPVNNNFFNYDEDSLTVYKRINSEMFSKQGVIPPNLALKFSHAIFDVIFENGYKIDIEADMKDFDKDVDSAIDLYYSKSYDLEQFNPKTLRLVYEHGWEILTNKFDLINLYLVGKRKSDIVFFKKGSACVMMSSNGLNLTHFQPINTFFSDDTESVKLRQDLVAAGLLWTNHKGKEFITPGII